MPAEPLSPSAAHRLANWKRKLLDLTLRNKLLNYQARRSEIPLVCPDLSALAKVLIAGRKMSFAATDDTQGSEASVSSLLGVSGKKPASIEAAENLNRRKLTVSLEEAEMDARLTGLFRAARTQLQEGGASTLYIALGFVEWRPKDKERSCLAPLLLLPVTLYRTSVRAGIKLTSADEAPRINPTLLQMLRQDFRLKIPGINEDEVLEDIDIPKILALVKRGVNPKGFKVVDKVVLSIFSFAKYHMWKDLVEREDLLAKNKMVRHLLEYPNSSYKSDIAFAEETELDDDFHANDLLAPFSYDSSQLACIASADRGKSFVLHGPPGTGKSQTIGNLIAHMMGKGKKVLFVSEKMAALNVVHQRLTSIGLGKFCLELHSNKANKREVIKQLREAYDLHAEMRSRKSTRDKTGESLMRIRDDLNAYVKDLHAKHPPGISIYEALGPAVRGGECEAMELAWQDVSIRDENDLDEIHAIAFNLAERMEGVRDLLQTPISRINHVEWYDKWEKDMTAAADVMLASSARCRKASHPVVRLLGFNREPSSMRELETMQRIADILPKQNDESLSSHFGTIASLDLQALFQGIELLKEHGNLISRMSSAYSADEIAKFSVMQSCQIRRLPKGHEGSLTGVWKWAWRMYDRCLLRGRSISDVDEELRLITRTHEVLELLNAIDTKLRPYNFWLGLESDVDVLSRLAKLESDFRNYVQVFSNQPDLVAKMRIGLAIALGDSISGLDDGMTHMENLSSFVAACNMFKSDLSAFEKLLSSPSEFSEDPNMFDAVETTAATIKKHRRRLRDWCFWRQARCEAADYGLEKSLVGLLTDAEFPPKDFSKLIMKSYYNWWLKVTLDKKRDLRLFESKRHDEKILKFRDLDESFCRETSEQVAIKISRVPEYKASYYDRVDSNVLLREFQKKRSHLPIRQLMDFCEGTVRRLTPCFLMSPLSVAQYLSRNFNNFDVVIFDEASQIPVWDAVGAISRGEQIIVAGDDKQMPPTTFFDRSETESEDSEKNVQDLESILNEMAGAAIPSRNLRWHYRSKHESLIAFSNYKYYNNDLITFPSAATCDDAIVHHFVKGIYDRGKSNTNSVEAHKLVEDVLARLRSAHDAGIDPSIGVITFNSRQQKLIEDLLDNACKKDAKLEKYFSEDESAEPVFVKNIETVQGDERDVCLMSTTYGPDLAGRLLLNFGPLNAHGGERRLNVSVTRARGEMVVYTSLKPEWLDVSKVSHDGVKHLRDYLTYARDGMTAMYTANSGSAGDYESDFEREVADMLTARGWKLDAQVGVARYRIDLGVVHPNEPGKYICGVECDGAMYHSAATARDRDKVRERALVHLGWKLVRVWSTSFFRDPHGTIDEVHQELEQILAEQDGDKEPIALLPDQLQ